MDARVKPGHDTGAVETALHQHPLSFRRDSSPLLFGRRGVRPLLPSLTGVRERSAERRYGLHLAPCGAVCRVTGTRTPRRSTAAILGSATVLRRRTGGPYPHVIQTAFAPPFIQAGRSHSRQPPHRVRTVPEPPGTGCEPRLQAPHPAPPTRRLMRAPSIEQGMASVQGNRNGTIEIRITLFVRC